MRPNPLGAYVRDGAQRKPRFELDTARRQLFAREGTSAEYDLVSKSLAKPMGVWRIEVQPWMLLRWPTATIMTRTSSLLISATTR